MNIALPQGSVKRREFITSVGRRQSGRWGRRAYPKPTEKLGAAFIPPVGFG
jgi:hypothetical protein